MTRIVDHMLAARRSHYDRIDWGVTEPYQLEVQRDLADILPADVSSILDLGCGNGFLTNSLPHRCTIVGVDISSVALHKLAVPGCLASAAQLPFADQSFDLVMANDVLEHLLDEELAAAVSEIERVAKRYIITTVPFAEDLTVSRQYSPEDDALHHVNEHLRSFDLPVLKSLYGSFDLDSVVFSGSEWQRESRPVEAFNALMIELGASPLADHPEEAVLSHEDRTQIMQLLRADQARALGRTPEIIDWCRLRTEIMGLYRRRTAGRTARRVDHAIREKAKHAASIPFAAIDLSVIDFRNFDRHRQAWLPTMARFPYVVTTATVATTSLGARFTPSEGNSSWELRVGFFCKFEGKSRMEIAGTAEGEATLAVAQYGADHGYRNVATKSVRGAFQFSLDDIDISHSQYGALFSITGEGAGVAFETIRIDAPEPTSRMIYAQPAEYLRVAGDEVDCFLSCRYYGRDVPALEWFDKPRRVRSRADTSSLRSYHRASEIAAVTNLLLKYQHHIRRENTDALTQIHAEVAAQQKQLREVGGQIDEAVAGFGKSIGEANTQVDDHRQQLLDLGGRIDAVVAGFRESFAEANTQVDDHRRQLLDLGGRIDAVAEQVLESAATHLRRIDAVAEQVLDSAATHLRRIDALAEQVVETAAAQQRSIEALTARLRSVENIAASGTQRVVMLAGEVQTIRHEQRLRRGALGALRQIFDINHYIGIDGGPKPGARLPLTARAYFRFRRAVVGRLMRRARASLVAEPAVTVATPPPNTEELIPRTATMLVPDDRIDRRVLLSGRSLSQAGWRITVIAAPYPEPFDQDQLDFPELQIVRVDTGRGVLIPPEALPGNRRHSPAWRDIYFYHFNFLELALNHPAQIYVANDLPVLPAAAVAAAQSGGALVYDAHELFPEIGYYTPEQRALYSEAEADLIQDAALVTTINQSIAEEMGRRYGIPTPDVILNAPAAPQTGQTPLVGGLRQELRVPAEKRILLYQGALSLYRNLEDLIAAMAAVQNEDVVLVMMGPGAERRAALEGIARDGGTLGQRVLFHDPVPQGVLLSYTAEAEVGIVPYPAVDLNSRYCTPNKLFEFIVAGVPILANDLPELRKFVHDTGFGQVHPLDGPNAIAGAIDAMFRSDLRPYRERLTARRHEFTWQAQGRKLVTLYQPLGLAGDKPAGEPTHSQIRETTSVASEAGR